MTRYEIKTRPGLARGTAPKYGSDGREAPLEFSVTMAERGRVVLPAEVRERLKIKEGDRLAGRLEPDGTISLQTPAAFARSLRGLYKHLAVPGRSIVDELIAERRREARLDKGTGAPARTKRRGRRDA